jgi:hypothetical protein
MFAKTLKNSKIWLFSILLAASWIYASAESIVAVLEVVVSEDADDESKALELTVQQTRFLTDELRKQAVLALAKTYTVLTREKIIALSVNVPENATGVVDIGRAIKSDYVTRGFLNSLGDLLVITVELYNCESGLLLADFVKMAPDLKGLLEIIHENAPILFKKINPPEPVAAVVPPPQPDASSASVSIPTNIPKSETKIKNTTWLAIGLDVLGVAAFGFGLSQFAAGNGYYDKYKDNYYTKLQREAAYKDAKNAKSLSEISYIAGGVLLASGITVHILF